MRHEATDIIGISRCFYMTVLAISFNANITLIYSDLNHNNGEVLSDKT